MRRLPIRWRIALLFVVGFVLTGAALVVFSYQLVEDSLTGGFGRPSDARSLLRQVDVEPGQLALQVPDGFEPRAIDPETGDVAALPGPILAPDTVVTIDGRSFSEVVEDLRDEVVGDTLDTLLVWSVTALAVVAALAAAAGWWLSGRALRPVREVTSTVRAISPTNLGGRVDHHGPSDELSELADTFDGVLDRLEGAMAGQRQFSAMASHELRTPLTTMALEADLALSDPDITDGHRQLARSVRREAGRSSLLVERLLQLTRSQAGVRALERIDLAGVVGDVVGSRAEAHTHVHLEVVLDDAEIEGDPTLVQSLVANLVDNAIRHNEPGGWAQFSVDGSGGWATLTAENTGPVVTDDDLARLLEPFHRSDANPDGLGHGLGLTIVRTVVEAHQGRLDVAARPDGGLEITVDLPSTATAVVEGQVRKTPFFSSPTDA